MSDREPGREPEPEQPDERPGAVPAAEPTAEPLAEPTAEPAAEFTEPPAAEPPAAKPPAVEPPAVEPPAVEPPAVEPPAVEPPAVEPPAAEPSVERTVAQPPTAPAAPEWPATPVQAHVPPPDASETTDPLPPVQADPTPLQAAINQPTAALPLLDLLAPRQSGPHQPASAGASAGPPQPYQPTQYHHPGPVHGGPPNAMGGARRGGSGPRGWQLVAVVAGSVVLLGLIGWMAMGSLPTGQQSTEQPPPPATTTSPVLAAGGYQFTQHTSRADTDCAGNAYGQVAEFFRSRPCTGLRRLLLTSAVNGRPVVVSVSTVTMPSRGDAAALRQLADTNGTGNVADLLRAGVRVPQVPPSLTNAAYASGHSGQTVVIVEADYTDPSVRTDDPLERIAEAALQLGQG